MARKRQPSRSNVGSTKGHARRGTAAPTKTTPIGIKHRSTKQTRFAVVGLGWIAQVAVLPAFAHARNATLTGLVSDDSVKLDKLGRKYRVPNRWTYAEYDEALKSGEIDAVYVALPNSMHRDYVVCAANAGVHVLCEKPLAVTADECIDMIEAANANDVKLMTAYRLHFEEANLRAIETAQSGRLGDLRLFNSTFCMKVEDEDNIRLQRESGGGTLYYIGIYCINAARSLFRDEPIEVVACSERSRDPKFREVDEMTAAILRFPHDRFASFICSFGAADVSTYEIVGTNGSLRLDPAYTFAGALTHTLTINGKTNTKTFSKRDQFAPELQYFADCIQLGRDPEPSGKEGLADVRIIEALYQSARSGSTVRLSEVGAKFPRKPSKRPSIAQEMKFPPVRKPQLVHANDPSE